MHERKLALGVWYSPRTGSLEVLFGTGSVQPEDLVEISGESGRSERNEHEYPCERCTEHIQLSPRATIHRGRVSNSDAPTWPFLVPRESSRRDGNFPRAAG